MNPNNNPQTTLEEIVEDDPTHRGTETQENNTESPTTNIFEIHGIKVTTYDNIKKSLEGLQDPEGPSLDSIAGCEAWVNSGGDINAYDGHGYTQVHYAVRRGRLNVLKWLLANDGDVLKPTMSRGSLPLHLSVEAGDIKMMHFLVSRGANPNKVDYKGRTPLHWAARLGRILNTAYLLQLPNTNINLRDHQGRTACHWAVINKDHDKSQVILRYLIKYKADVTIADNLGLTALHWSCASSSPCFYLLLEKDDQVLHMKCHMGKTPREHATDQLFIDRVMAVEREHRILPKIWRQHRYEYSTYFWFFGFFTIFTIMPIYVSVAMFLWVCFFLFRSIRRPERSRIFFALWNSANALTIITILVEIIPYSVNWLLVCIYLVFHTLCYHQFYKTHTTPPGHLIGTQSDIVEIHQLMKGDASPEYVIDHYCLSCLVKKVPRSKHCTTCNQCVSKFDHHCSFIDTCIGINNTKHFFIFVFLLLMGQMSVISLLYHYLSSQQEESVTDLFQVILDMYSNHAWSLFILIFHLVTFPMTVCVQLSHVVLLWYGLTLNEWVNKYRYEYLKDTNGKFYNPFSKGCLGNLMEMMYSKPS